MTTIEYLGHAGLAVRHGGKLLLCDPWMSPKGAYNASWFQYPDYVGELAPLLEPDAVYVSHEHLDHYDPEFLGRLRRDLPILTGRATKKRLVAKLRRLGFQKIIELDGFDGFELAPDFVVRISTPRFHCPPHWFDSCALLELGNLKVFNQNDCNLALPVADLRAEGIDVLLSQATPAIWYPLVYTTYTEEQKVGLKRTRLESALTGFVGAAKALQPRLAIPFAGPPCFFDPELAGAFFGPDSMFPTPPAAIERLRSETEIPGLVLAPGDVLRIGEVRGADDEFRVERCPAYADFDYERDRVAYYERNRAAKEKIVAEVLASVPAATPGLFDRFRRHFLPFLKGHPYFVERIGIRVLFRVTGPEGGNWVVDFSADPKPELVYEWDEAAHCQYQFEMPSSLVDQVLRDELSWEDAFLSLRFKAHRDPDRYNQHLFTLFKMSDSRALNAIQQAETADREHDTFVLERDGETYEIQRYCPHGGADLAEAEIEDGHLVCPGHHWRFSLADGRCSNADGRIKISRRPSKNCA